MRRIIFCVIGLSLFAGSAAWAAAEDDDKNVRSSEKSSPSADKKPKETAKPLTDAGTNTGSNLGTNPGKPVAANPEVASELKELRQLVQEQAERLRGLQQRLAEVEGEVAAGKPGSTNAAATATDAVPPAALAESAASGELLAGAQPGVTQPAAAQPAAPQREEKRGKKNHCLCILQSERHILTPAAFWFPPPFTPRRT